ncbi:MAG: small multi-drug export protein [Deltaproteobacteria bacterium]|nr:small multi-drug export protein [Deltaproteobacteria bacterium]MBN2687027.1 small multi-drug export protein [Deltaproteobacteria bacterium]
MIDIVLYLKNNLADNFVVYFIPLYILGGRPVAVLSAQLLGHTALFIVPVVVMLDILQIPMFYYLYGALSDRLLVRKLSERAGNKERKLRESGFFRWMQVMGAPGVVAITLLPMKGCGMWSGVLLSKLLRYPKPYSYFLLILGSVLGCAVLLGIGEFILTLWGMFTGR